MIKKLPKPFFAGLLIILITLAGSGKLMAQNPGAGYGNILTLTGSGFGSGPGPSSYVEFTSADVGNAYFIVQSYDYVSWSDTQIVVKIPSGAGTGYVKIIVSSTTFITNAPVTINWNLLNAFYNGATYLPKIVNRNNAGGYTFNMSTDFNANAAASQSFTRAVNTWKCSTYVNWSIGAPTAVNIASVNDGISVVRFSDDLDAGVLAQTSFNYHSNDGVRWEVWDIDLTFSGVAKYNWNFGPGLPAAPQYDFETVALHELGHAQMLGHVINVADVMNASVDHGVSKRSPGANNIYAIGLIMAGSTASTDNYVFPPMVALNSGNCSVAASSNADLANLTLSNGVLSPVFAAGTTGYTATVGNDIASLTVTPTVSDAGATVKVNGVTVPSGSASASQPLTVGPNVITTAVTAADGTTTKTYTLTVTRISNNALLNAIKITPATTLTAVSGPDYKDYTTTVPNSETSVKITPTAQDVTATIKVNGVAVASGAASAAIPLNVGINVINTVVTAQDGITAKTYSITVTRVSNNALLNAIKISPATPLTVVSGPDYKDYTTTVPISQTSVKITPAAQDAAATIKVNGVTVASGTASAAIPLNVGDNIINTVVTAQDGVTKNTYSIKFTRLANADLANLTLSSGTLTPVFAAGTTSYTATVSNATASVTVKPTATDAAATIKVNGVAVASGTASAAIPLNVGINVINTVVTAQDGITAKTYSITVTRVSNNALLNAIKITPATPLTVVSGPDYKDYTTTVPISQTSVKITPAAQDAAATIKVNGVTVASGTASAAIPLNVGDNVINTVVTAQDGVTKNTYSIKFSRLANANLANLTLSSGTLTPVFAAGTTSYTATVSNATASVTVTPTTSDAAATIKVNGATVASGTASASQPLTVGPNVISTVVTATDGTTTKTYTLTVTRVSNNALLNAIKINPATALTVVTGADYKDYITTVPNSETSVKITPTAQDATATIKVNGVTVASGTASTAIALSVGDNIVNTVVTAQDGITKNTYSIKFTRQPPGGAVLLYTEKADPILDNSMLVHQNVSPNGDGNGDVLVIEGIAAYPDNKLRIMSRNGTLVYEANGYNNTTKVFNGHSGTNGKLLQAGTYFYSLDYKDGAETKHKTGFIVLKY